MPVIAPTLALLLGTVCASTPAAGADPVGATQAVRLHGQELALARRVDEDRAAATVRRFTALGPRMGGTASGRAARDLRLALLEEAGLAVEVQEDGAKSAYEPLRWRVTARIGAGQRDLTSAWPMVGAPAVTASGLVLDLESGAGGALLNRSGGAPQSGDQAPVVVLADGRSTRDGHYAQIRGQSPQGAPTFGLGRDDGQFLRAALERGAAVELDVLLEVEAGEAPVQTVVAHLAARAGARPGYLLFCAHGDADSGGPGANDNGSGEAIVMEIALAYAAAIADGDLEPPPIELRFAWWGSEIFSSRAFLRRALLPDATPLLGVLNFDQCGYGAGRERLYIEPDDLEQNEAAERVLVQLLGDAGGADGFPSDYASVRSLGGTDSYVFSGSPELAVRGVPSMTIYASAWGRPAAHPRTPGSIGESFREGERVEVDFDPWYHSAGDLPQNTTDREPWHLGWQARVGAIAGLRLAAELAAAEPGQPR